MKKIKYLFIISIMFILFSCGNNGDKFIGNWVSEQVYTMREMNEPMNSPGRQVHKIINVKKRGNAYYIEIIALEIYGNKSFTAEYENGNLKVMGQIVLSYDNGS